MNYQTDYPHLKETCSRYNSVKNMAPEDGWLTKSAALAAINSSKGVENMDYVTIIFSIFTPIQLMIIKTLLSKPGKQKHDNKKYKVDNLRQISFSGPLVFNYLFHCKIDQKL